MVKTSAPTSGKGKHRHLIFKIETIEGQRVKEKWERRTPEEDEEEGEYWERSREIARKETERRREVRGTMRDSSKRKRADADR